MIAVGMEARERRRGSKLNMTEQEFQTKLAELMGEITTLPSAERKKLEKLANETRERHERPARPSARSRNPWTTCG